MPSYENDANNAVMTASANVERNRQVLDEKVRVNGLDAVESIEASFGLAHDTAEAAKVAEELALASIPECEASRGAFWEAREALRNAPPARPRDSRQ